MLRNYLVSAFRNLTKHKMFSVINIAGLALGLACCLMIFLFIKDEFSYDAFHANTDQIYRIVNDRSSEGRQNHFAVTPPAYGPTLEQVFPEVLASVRIFDFGEPLITYEDKKFFEPNFMLADPNIFDVFTFPLFQGDPKQVLQQPYSLVISQSMAKKYFGKEDPVGKTVTVSGNQQFMITGVMKDLPAQSHLKIHCIAPFTVLEDMVDPARLENWIWQQFYTYIVLPQGYDHTALESKLPGLLEKYAQADLAQHNLQYKSYLQPLQKIHLYSASLEYDIAQKGDIRYVYALSFTAIFSLLIACFNFMNLSTARSVQRAKEVGVRKTIGAHRFQLMWQFLHESLLLTFMALLLALLLVQIALPVFNQWAGKELNLQPLTQPLLIAGLVLFVLFVSVIAGSYPAVCLSAFKPVQVLKGHASSVNQGNYIFRKLLVMLEFTMCSVFIIGTVIIFHQVEYLQEKNLGFNKEQLIVLPLRDSVMQQNYVTLKANLLQNSSISAATASFGVPGGIFAGDGILLPGRESEFTLNMFLVDPDYIPTMGMEVIAGRNFSADYVTDLEEAFIINETAVKELGWKDAEDALGKEIYWNKWMRGSASEDSLKRGKVIGVVKDFHYKSLHQKIEPVVLHMFPAVYSNIIVRVHPENVSATIDFLKQQWQSLAADWPFEYEFLDEQFAAKYRSEQVFGNIFGVFTFFTIFIACLGLFGLVSFAAQQRTKEIGIRRVLGASVLDITSLLSKDFMKLVLIGFMVAAPVAWYAMHQWLEGFAYRISVEWWIFIATGGLILLIALLTVSYESMKAAMANPVKSLRSE